MSCSASDTAFKTFVNSDIYSEIVRRRQKRMIAKTLMLRTNETVHLALSIAEAEKLETISAIACVANDGNPDEEIWKTIHEKVSAALEII